LSAWLADAKPQAAVDIPVFVLDVGRDLLRERIAGRFQTMLDADWLDEVRWLDALQLADRHPALRAVGYRQLQAHVHGDCSLAEATAQGITATRQYAKRQRTWFAHQTPDALCGDAETLFPLIRAALNRISGACG